MGTLSPPLAGRDLLDTIGFYKKSLGFTRGMAFPGADNPQYADLSKDGMFLMSTTTESIGIGSDEKLDTGVDMYLNIDTDIDEYYNELKSKNARIVVEIKDEPFGISDFTVEDIIRYKLTFSQLSKNVRKCMSCSMYRTKPEDFGGGSTDNLLCAYYTTQDGSLKSYDAVLGGMIGFMVMAQKMDRSTAEDAARAHISRMPAWGGEVLSLWQSEDAWTPGLSNQGLPHIFQGAGAVSN